MPHYFSSIADFKDLNQLTHLDVSLSDEKQVSMVTNFIEEASQNKWLDDETIKDFIYNYYSEIDLQTVDQEDYQRISSLCQNYDIDINLLNERTLEMKKSYRTLEFSFIQDYIKNYCFSEMAKKRIDQIQPFQDIDDLKLYQDDISSAMKIIYAYGRIPLAPYEDIKEILQKAQKGGVCYPQDLLKIVQILKNVQEVQAYLDQEIEQSHLLEILSLLYLPKDLYNEILKCVDPSGNIYDHASHELYRLRRQISAIEANMRKKIEALRAQNKDYLSHDVISTRNDHFVLPVNVSYKTQIKGIHHGHSSSGRTTYVEPEEIVSYNNQLSQIKQDEQLEIHRILLELTKKVRSYDRVLNEDLEIMIEIDAVFAISEYGKKLDMVMPVVDEDCQEIELLKARHPLIDQKEVVANDIVLKKPQDILLISGSNTGGKTVALKTAGLLSLMAICGLPIPVTQAKLPLFDEIFVDVGDEQSIEQSLSTFSSHMKRWLLLRKRRQKIVWLLLMKFVQELILMKVKACTSYFNLFT